MTDRWLDWQTRIVDLLQTLPAPENAVDGLVGQASEAERSVYGSAAGDYLIEAGRGRSYLYGLDGDDIYAVNRAKHIVEEADQGFDTLLWQGGWAMTLPSHVEALIVPEDAEARHIKGNDADNLLIGSTQDNKLVGFAGDDVLFGRGGNDRLVGDAGDDIAWFDGAFEAYTVEVLRPGKSDETAISDTSGTTTTLGVEHFRFADVTLSLEDLLAAPASPPPASPPPASPPPADDIPDASSTGTSPASPPPASPPPAALDVDSAMVLAGFEPVLSALGLTLDGVARQATDGQLELSGTASNDLLVTAAQAQARLEGLAGDDVYVVNEANEVIEQADQGTDVILWSGGWAFTLPGHVEAVAVLPDADARHLKGNALDNSLFGSSGDNKMFGYDGDDAFYSLGGNDIIQGAAGNDSAWFANGFRDYAVKLVKPGRSDEVTVADATGTTKLTGVETLHFADISLTLDELMNPPDSPVFRQTLTVGPDGDYATLQSAIDASHPGDTLVLAEGTYVDTTVVIPHGLTIKGGGDAPSVLSWQSDGWITNSKGIFYATDTVGTLRVENLVFEGASVSDRNGAGIRFEGDRLEVSNVVFRDNENGILATTPDHEADIVIENSQFIGNGFGDGYTHAIYVSKGASLTIDGSYFADTKIGHHIKSLAPETTVRNSVIDDGDGTSSYAIDVNRGGSLLVDNNLIIQEPSGENNIMLHYGVGRGGTPDTVTISDNVVVNGHGTGRFAKNDSEQVLEFDDNILLTLDGTSLDLVLGPAAGDGNVKGVIGQTDQARALFAGQLAGDHAAVLDQAGVDLAPLLDGGVYSDITF